MWVCGGVWGKEVFVVVCVWGVVGSDWGVSGWWKCVWVCAVRVGGVYDYRDFGRVVVLSFCSKM